MNFIFDEKMVCKLSSGVGFTLFWHIGINFGFEVVYFRSSDSCYVLLKQKKVIKAEERKSDKQTA